MRESSTSTSPKVLVTSTEQILKPIRHLCPEFPLIFLIYNKASYYSIQHTPAWQVTVHDLPNAIVLKQSRNQKKRANTDGRPEAANEGDAGFDISSIDQFDDVEAIELTLSDRRVRLLTCLGMLEEGK